MYLFQFRFMHNVHYGEGTIIHIETQAQWGIRFALMESTVFCKADAILQYHETSTVSEATQVPQEIAGKKTLKISISKCMYLKMSCWTW